jgi:hypothetical protein
LLLSGCSQVAKIPDDQLAQDLNIAAKTAVKYSLQAAVRKTPADASRIAADATTVDGILTKTVIPAFSGASTADVVRSSVDTALALLKSKITDPRVAAAIDAGVEIVLLDVTLPATPTGKLDARTLKALNGVFTGISAGIEVVFPPAPVK